MFTSSFFFFVTALSLGLVDTVAPLVLMLSLLLFLFLLQYLICLFLGFFLWYVNYLFCGALGLVFKVFSHRILKTVFLFITFFLAASVSIVSFVSFLWYFYF